MEAPKCRDTPSRGRFRLGQANGLGTPKLVCKAERFGAEDPLSGENGNQVLAFTHDDRGDAGPPVRSITSASNRYAFVASLSGVR